MSTGDHCWNMDFFVTCRISHVIGIIDFLKVYYLDSNYQDLGALDRVIDLG